jgi:hypothetical protein
MVAPSTRAKKQIAIVLGSLIIIVTFIVRDVQREDLKGKLDALRSGQAIFLARSDVSFLTLRVVDLSSDVRQFIHRYDLDRKRGEPSIEDKVRYDIEALDSELLASRQVLQNVQLLLRGTEEDVPESAEYEKQKRESDSIESEFNSALAQKIPADANKNSVLLSALREQLVKFHLRADPLRESALSLAQRCFERSQDVSEHMEKQLHCINAAFYVLFSIGVLVNALGSLMGLDIEQKDS